MGGEGLRRKFGPQMENYQKDGEHSILKRCLISFFFSQY